MRIANSHLPQDSSTKTRLDVDHQVVKALFNSIPENPEGPDLPLRK